MLGTNRLLAVTLMLASFAYSEVILWGESERDELVPAKEISNDKTRKNMCMTCLYWGHHFCDGAEIEPCVARTQKEDKETKSLLREWLDGECEEGSTLVKTFSGCEQEFYKHSNKIGANAAYNKEINALDDKLFK